MHARQWNNIIDKQQILAETGRGSVIMGDKSTISNRIKLRPIPLERGRLALPDEAWLFWNPYPNHTI